MPNKVIFMKYYKFRWKVSCGDIFIRSNAFQTHSRCRVQRVKALFSAHERCVGVQTFWHVIAGKAQFLFGCLSEPVVPNLKYIVSIGNSIIIRMQYNTNCFYVVSYFVLTFCSKSLRWRKTTLSLQFTVCRHGTCQVCMWTLLCF